MEALNLNLKLGKVFKLWKSYESVKFGKVMKAKRRGSEIFKFVVLTLLCVEILCI